MRNMHIYMGVCIFIWEYVYLYGNVMIDMNELQHFGG